MLADRLDALRRFYGTLGMPPRDPFILFVWEVLSAQAIPHKRDAALAALKRIRALTPDAVARAPQKKLEEAVALAGPYLDQRMRAIRAGADRFRRNPGLAESIRGRLGPARRAVKALPQMVDGGAQRMLLLGGGHLVFPLDARVARVARRLGCGGPPSQRVARTALRKAIVGELPPSAGAYARAYVYLAHHATTTCTERAPHCAICPLVEGCPGRERTCASPA
jgi:endonuclease III